MAETRIDASVVDAVPVALYGKESQNSKISWPVLVSSSGSLMISAGLNVPEYDSLIISYASGNISNMYFFLGGTTGTLTMTFSLGYSGGNLISLQNSIS